jgi:hypoxanthine phosphoribosyltransferase
MEAPVGIVLRMAAPRVLISASDINHRVKELGAQISKDYGHVTMEQPVFLIGVLKGSWIFLADLARAITVPARFDFIGVASYGMEKTTSGQVRLTKDLDSTIENCDVILVEDIADTGVTLSYLIDLLKRRKPKSLRVAALLSKPTRRTRDVKVDYIAFEIPDQFVVGYGLDYAHTYRNLPDVCVLG